MSLPPPQTKEFVDRLTSLAIECRDELSQGTRSIQEIELLIRQTQQEVDRLSQREQSQNNRLREVENSLESFSRSDIRDVLVANHEVQMRLFMMRSQLEQLESRRDSVRKQQEKLRLLLNLAEINRDYEHQVDEENQTRILAGTVALSDGVDLASHIIMAREKERDRLARQLTDGPAQVLSNVILRAQILERVAERVPEQLPVEIADLQKLASDSLLDVRRTIFEIRPLMIDELGLVATLRRYCVDFSRENNATINVDGPDRDDPIPATSRIELFRLIQRAMIALVKANAGMKLNIQIRYEEAQLLVRLDSASPDDSPSEQAVRFARDPDNVEALSLIGASVQTESFPSGQRITLFLPISE
jgi:two-component system, NarL family, sensor histidine kinase DegS